MERDGYDGPEPRRVGGLVHVVKSSHHPGEAHFPFYRHIRQLLRNLLTMHVYIVNGTFDSFVYWEYSRPFQKKEEKKTFMPGLCFVYIERYV